jgi:hypothetical protein
VGGISGRLSGDLDIKGEEVRQSGKAHGRCYGIRAGDQNGLR